MSKQISFSKYEQKVLPNFRQKISQAESTEDVKKFFVYTAQELLESIFAGKIDFKYEDIELIPGKKPHYLLSKQFAFSDEFKSVWKDSDLPRLLSRLAETAVHRYKHLKKRPEKTESKIRMK
ncbi:MAG: hypothetical protein U9N47_09275 [Thermodesulfobacteriota bacterium]|nr:hypothetical protein [Thermodesulfobacteriota bacterium]